MENTHVYTCGFDLKTIELEHIEHAICGGATASEVMAAYPQYAEEIAGIIERVAWFCWGDTLPIEHEFHIQGTRISATFPFEHDEKTMSLITNMLSESHARNRINAAKSQSASGGVEA